MKLIQTNMTAFSRTRELDGQSKRSILNIIVRQTNDKVLKLRDAM